MGDMSTYISDCLWMVEGFLCCKVLKGWLDEEIKKNDCVRNYMRLTFVYDY